MDRPVRDASRRKRRCRPGSRRSDMWTRRSKAARGALANRSLSILSCPAAIGAAIGGLGDTSLVRRSGKASAGKIGEDDNAGNAGNGTAVRDGPPTRVGEARPLRVSRVLVRFAGFMSVYADSLRGPAKAAAPGRAAARPPGVLAVVGRAYRSRRSAI